MLNWIIFLLAPCGGGGHSHVNSILAFTIVWLFCTVILHGPFCTTLYMLNKAKPNIMIYGSLQAGFFSGIGNWILGISKHCKDTIPKIRNIYSQKENFYIHVSVCDFNISTIGLHAEMLCFIQHFIDYKLNHLILNWVQAEWSLLMSSIRGMLFTTRHRRKIFSLYWVDAEWSLLCIECKGYDLLLIFGICSTNIG